MSDIPSLGLAEVDTAIAAILAGGQSYRIGSRSLTRADLATLIKLRRELAIDAGDAVDNGDPCGYPNTSVATFNRR